MPDRQQPASSEIDALVVAARYNRGALGRLYDHYYEKILGYCLKRLNDRAAAEDVCGDTFLYVARKMPSFRGETEQDFRHWIYRISTNEVNAYLRRHIRRKELWRERLQQQRPRASPLTAASNWSDTVDWTEVQQAIGQLSAKEQSIMTLRLLESMPHDEIAQVLNIRPGTVRVTYSRAVNKLRAWLTSDASSSNGCPTQRE